MDVATLMPADEPHRTRFSIINLLDTHAEPQYHGYHRIDAAPQQETLKVEDIWLIDSLMKYSRDGDTINVSRLLEAGAPVSYKDVYGWTALHFAATSGNEDLCRLLCEKGADKTCRTNDHQTAFDIALYYGAMSCANVLSPLSPFVGKIDFCRGTSQSSSESQVEPDYGSQESGSNKYSSPGQQNFQPAYYSPHFERQISRPLSAPVGFQIYQKYLPHRDESNALMSSHADGTPHDELPMNNIPVAHNQHESGIRNNLLFSSSLNNIAWDPHNDTTTQSQTFRPWTSSSNSYTLREADICEPATANCESESQCNLQSEQNTKFPTHYSPTPVAETFSYSDSHPRDIHNHSYYSGNRTPETANSSAVEYNHQNLSPRSTTELYKNIEKRMSSPLPLLPLDKTTKIRIPSLQQSLHCNSRDPSKGGKPGGLSGELGKPKKDILRKCAECLTTETPQWRGGREGAAVLCNACGLKYFHIRNREKKNARRREKYMIQRVLNRALKKEKWVAYGKKDKK